MRGLGSGVFQLFRHVAFFFLLFFSFMQSIKNLAVSTCIPADKHFLSVCLMIRLGQVGHIFAYGEVLLRA